VLRVLLARAASSPDAGASVRRLLADTTLPATATIDLLRSLGPRIESFGGDARAAFARLGAAPEFRTRYLLLGPAAALAGSDPAAKEVLTRALGGGKEPWIRVRALEVAPREAAYAQAFTAALEDPHVRVREAAARALGEGRFASSSAQLSDLLENDAWPIARRAAASSLGAMPDDAASRKVLIDALDDPAPWVRAAVAESLGLRRSPGAAPKLRDKLDDREEPVEVRRAAALSLGALCDAESVDLLDKLGRRIADPMSSAEDRAIGEAALYGLLQLHPPDLDKRLEPLLKTPAARTVQRARARIGQGCARR
jgi:HEAT repeat protein